MTAIPNRLDQKLVPLQVRTFSNWASLMLKKRGIKIKDITTQLANGVNLVNLAEVLTGATKHRVWSRNPTKPFQKTENCDLALSMFRNQGVKLGRITAKDIADGSTKATLSLIWALIMKYSIEPVSTSARFSSHKNVILQSLMKWCIKRTENYSGIKDFMPIHKGLSALISNFYPNVIDYSSLCKNNDQTIAQSVITALQIIGIPALFEWNDLLKPMDDKSLFTQISFVKKKLQPISTYEKTLHLIENDAEECESEEISGEDLESDLDDDSSCFSKEIETYEKPISHRPFMLLMTIEDNSNSRIGNVLAMTVVDERFLNTAGFKIDLAIPNPCDPAQLFTFGEGEWITVIDSVKMPGMVWDVANRDNLNPPEGTPFYLFPFHGRHNQRFTYNNGHVISMQNGQFVTYVGKPYPLVMKSDCSNLLQCFRLQYI